MKSLHSSRGHSNVGSNLKLQITYTHTTLLHTQLLRTPSVLKLELKIESSQVNDNSAI